MDFSKFGVRSGPGLAVTGAAGYQKHVEEIVLKRQQMNPKVLRKEF